MGKAEGLDDRVRLRLGDQLSISSWCLTSFLSVDWGGVVLGGGGGLLLCLPGEGDRVVLGVPAPGDGDDGGQGGLPRLRDGRHLLVVVAALRSVVCHCVSACVRALSNTTK